MRVAITGFAAHYASRAGFAGLVTPATSLRAARAPDAARHRASALGRELQRQLAQIGLRDGRCWRLAPDRVGVVYGSSKGDLARLDSCRAAAGLPSRARDWARWPDGFAAGLSRWLDARGPVLAPVAACATGAHALALGAGLLQSGRADVVVAGAIEPPQPEIVLAAYRNMGALSRAGRMRPFDARRDGFLPAWGAGWLLLEPEERARQRGAPVHGLLSGASLQCDATHLTAMNPSGDTIARAIENALRRAGNPALSYINAHGTATKMNDAIEARAIAQVFGASVPVSSTKGRTGHLLGAAGAVEAALCLLALREDFAPPTLGLEEPEGGLDFVMGEGRSLPMNAALSLNYGFGGHIGALVFEKG